MTAIDWRDLTYGDDYLGELKSGGLFSTTINPHDTQLAHYDSLIQRFAYNCRRNNGEFLNYISTANVLLEIISKFQKNRSHIKGLGTRN
jgi:hypothetical protein